MRPRYIQINQPETKKVHYEQANSVLKYRPDIILIEYPNNDETPGYSFNDFPPDKKPLKEVESIKKMIGEALDIHPWAEADFTLWDNIVELWRQGHQMFLYKIDAPTKLTKEMLSVWTGNQPRRNEWLWMVKQYIREKIMTSGTQYALSEYKEKEDPLVLVLVQSEHWNRVTFQLTQPAKQEIWDYYFGHLPDVTRENINSKIAEENETICRFWIKYSDFAPDPDGSVG